MHKLLHPLGDVNVSDVQTSGDMGAVLVGGGALELA
jgi:hypothetical protein